MSVVRHCEDFRGETRIDAWMWRIARNTLIDYFRRARPEEPVEEDDGREERRRVDLALADRLGA